MAGDKKDKKDHASPNQTTTTIDDHWSSNTYDAGVDGKQVDRFYFDAAPVYSTDTTVNFQSGEDLIVFHPETGGTQVYDAATDTTTFEYTVSDAWYGTINTLIVNGDVRADVTYGILYV